MDGAGGGGGGGRRGGGEADSGILGSWSLEMLQSSGGDFLVRGISFFFFFFHFLIFFAKDIAMYTLHLNPKIPSKDK